MKTIIINQELKDKRYIAFLVEEPDIYAIGENIIKANEYLEDIIHNLIIGEIKDNLKPLKLKSEEVNLSQIKALQNFHQKANDSKQIISFLNIDRAKIINNAFKSERTNVTIKSAYKVIAKNRGLNISEFLNAKLKEQLNLDY